MSTSMSSQKRPREKIAKTARSKSPAVSTSKIILQTANAHRGMSKNLFLVVLVLGVALIFSTILNMILFSMQPQDRFFAMDENMRVIELVSSDKPMHTDSAIINWATNTVSELNTLSFNSWRKQIQSISDKFEKKTFIDILTVMKDKGNLDLVANKRLNSIANLNGPAIITNQGKDKNGVFTWVVEVPLIINYESQKGVEHTKRIRANIQIKRVSTSEYPTGIKIFKYSERPDTNR